MNPLIHHPEWYRHLGLLTGPEVDAALTNPSTICSQPVANMVLPSLVITCQLERWEIQSPDPAQKGRLLDVATKVFEVLGETPIRAFGFNFNFEYPTGMENVDSYLSTLLATLPLSMEGGTWASFSWRRDEADRQTNAVLSPAKKDHAAFLLTNNFHYPIRAQGKFDLTPLLRSHFDGDAAEAEARLSSVAARFAAAKQG